MKLYLSIVIPAYNEEKNLKKGVLREVSDYLQSVDYQYEVVIVNDGSTDNTIALIKAFIKNKKQWRLIEASHGGKALTVMKGLLETKGEIAVFTDMDQATPLGEIENFFPKFARSMPAGRQEYDIVIGSRHGRSGAPLIRQLMAWGFATLRNLLLGLPFIDTQCGFKAFTKNARQKVFSKMIKEWERARATGAAVNAGFDVEALFLAKKMGFKIAEVPVNWHYVGTQRVELIKDSLDAVKDMLRIRWNDLTGKY